jgi:hypothetical protein
MRAYEIITEDQQLNEFWPLIVAWTPELLAALATGVRVAAPYVARGLTGAGNVAARYPVTTLAGAEYADQKYNNGDVTKFAWDKAPIDPNVKQNVETGVKFVTDPAGATKDVADTAVKNVQAKAADVAQNTASLVDNAQAAATVAAKGAWHSAEAAADDIAEIVRNNLTPDKIQMLADAAVKYALPAAVVVAILYGGKMLYDHMKASSQHQAKTA